MRYTVTLFGGRLFFSVASDYWMNLVLFAIIAGDVLAFELWVAPKIPMPLWEQGILLIQCVVSLVLLCCVGLCDPGIIKDTEVVEALRSQRSGATEATARVDASALQSGGVGDAQLFAHWCPVCEVYVARFDHHCFIVGGCIGYNTMLPFVSYLIMTPLLCLHGAVWCLVRLVTMDWPTVSIDLPHRILWLFSFEHVVPLAVLGCTVYTGLYMSLLGVTYVSYVVMGVDGHEVRRRQGRRVFSVGQILSCRGGHFSNVTNLCKRWGALSPMIRCSLSSANEREKKTET